MHLRSLFWFCCLLAAPSSATQVFSGETASGAHWRIEAPDDWQAGDPLVLYQHGFSFDASLPEPSLGPLRELQLAEGYAIAGSSFSQRGWAVFTAVDDNRELLSLVRQKLGEPGEIVPFGGSLGGLLALKIAEHPDFRDKVKGVYALCPAAAGARVWDAAIDLRLAYEVICAGNGELPTGAAPYPWAYDLADIPMDLGDFEEQAKMLETLLPLNECTGINLPENLRGEGMKQRLAKLKTFTGIDDDKFLVTNIAYSTYALGDLVRDPGKLDGASPFSTGGVNYGDAAIDAAIARVASDPIARLRMRWFSDFRGEVGMAKVLSLHTSGDQLVIPANQDALRKALPVNQLTSVLVAEDAPTHCGFKVAEGIAGWEALRKWKNGGAQPDVVALQTGCNAAIAAGAEGPCRFDAAIDVPNFDAKVRPRPAETVPVLDGRWSGEWFDPSRNGEGILLEMLDTQNALLYFFTYPPAGAPGKQAWMLATGRVIGNGIAFDDLRRPTKLADASIDAQRWGKGWLSFDDCSHGRLRWEGPDGWGRYEVPLARITALQGLDCTGTSAEKGVSSGSWYDPSEFGSGFLIEQIAPQLFVVLYFEPVSGDTQRWMSGVVAGDADAGTASGTLHAGQGPQFGPNYDPAQFTAPAAMELTNLKLGCGNTGSANYHFLDGRTPDSGAFALVRITRPLGVPGCP